MTAGPAPGRAARAVAFWLGPIDARRLSLFARVFALVFLFFVVGWGTHAREWLSVAGYHVSAAATHPAHPPPLPPLPVSLAVPLVVAMAGLAAWAALACRTRAPFVLLTASAVYIQLVDQASAFTINKLFVVGFAVLSLRPRARRDHRGRWIESAWALRTLQATVLIQYFTAGVCKVIHGDWLRSPDVLYTHMVGVYRTAAAAFMIHHAPAWLFTALAWSALAFELAGPVLFLTRWRLVAMLWGVGFQLSIALFMKDLIYFSAQMLSFYTLFLRRPRA